MAVIDPDVGNPPVAEVVAIEYWVSVPRFELNWGHDMIWLAEGAALVTFTAPALVQVRKI